MSYHRAPRVTVERLGHLFEQVDAGEDAVGQVRPVEDAHQDGRVAQVQLGDDVIADARRRRCCVRVERHAGDDRPQLGQPPILRAKVMTPLADAVSLINGK